MRGFDLSSIYAGGRIVFVSTTLTKATTILPMGLMFIASKGAIEHLVRVLGRDLGERGITVNAIAPGPVDTPLFRDGKPPHMVQWVAQLHPQKRIPMPDEVSSLVTFLAKEDSGWINGQIMHVNGVSCNRPQYHYTMPSIKGSIAIGIRCMKLL